jgi:hypothetical protein
VVGDLSLRADGRDRLAIVLHGGLALSPRSDWGMTQYPRHNGERRSSPLQMTAVAAPDSAPWWPRRVAQQPAATASRLRRPYDAVRCGLGTADTRLCWASIQAQNQPIWRRTRLVCRPVGPMPRRTLRRSARAYLTSHRLISVPRIAGVHGTRTGVSRIPIQATPCPETLGHAAIRSPVQLRSRVHASDVASITSRSRTA